MFLTYLKVYLVLMGVPMYKLLPSFVILLLLSTPVGAENGEWVEWIADAEISYANIDNLNLSAFSDDSHSDDRLALSTLFGRVYQFDGFTRMSVAFELDAQKYNDFDLMDNNQFGMNIGARHKFGLGFYQPYLHFNVNYRHREVEWDDNSADILFTSLEFGQHINNQLSLAASIDFTSADGEAGLVINPEISSEVFDQKFMHLSFFVDYILSQNWLVSASYAYRQGDFQSSCSKENVAKVLEVEDVLAITADGIFGGCVYKLDGRSNIYSASLGYSLSRHSALNFVMEHYQGRADVLEYQNTSYSLSFNYRY